MKKRTFLKTSSVLVTGSLLSPWPSPAIPKRKKKRKRKSIERTGQGIYNTVLRIFMLPRCSLEESIRQASTEIFALFLVSLYVLTFGLAFLETTANPFILALGDESTATRRLNLAQSFNPIGALLGQLVAINFILVSLQSADSSIGIFSELDTVTKTGIRTHDLLLIRDPYVVLGLFVLVMMVIFFFSKMPAKGESDHHLDVKGTFQRLFANSNYMFGVVAQVFYVGAQIMCWTYIVQYGENLVCRKLKHRVTISLLPLSFSPPG